jgi:hypothetical protein
LRDIDVNNYGDTGLSQTVQRREQLKTLKLIGIAAIASATLLVNTAVFAKDRTTGRGTGPVVYVTSQGLYYDSIVVADPLPMHGNFQQLTMGTHGLETEYGPGEVGHLGGRWWLDLNEDGLQNEGDLFFLCPLLGPGRTTL